MSVHYHNDCFFFSSHHHVAEDDLAHQQNGVFVWQMIGGGLGYLSVRKMADDVVVLALTETDELELGC